MGRSSVFWSAIRNWGQRLGTILTFFVLVRLLEPDEIGVFAAAAAVVALLDLFTDTGLGDALIQSKEPSRSAATAVLIFNVLFATVLYGVVFLFTRNICDFLGMQSAEDILRVAALALIVNSTSFVPQALLRKEFLFKRLAYRSLAASALGAATGIGMATFGFGVWSMVGQLLVTALINAVCVWYPPVLRPLAPDFRATLPYLKFGTNVFVSRILYFASTRIMEILIPSFFGPLALALYFMASRLPAVLSQMIVAVALDVSLPRFSKIAADRTQLSQAFFGGVSFSAGISVPAFFVLGALAPEITRVAFGPNGAGSETLMLPIAIMSAVRSVGVYNQVLLDSCGLPHINMRLTLANTILSIAVFVFMRNSDVNSFIYAYTAAQCLLIPVSFFIAMRYINLPFVRLIRTVAPCYVASIVALFGVVASRPYIAPEIQTVANTGLFSDFLVGVVLGFVFAVIYAAIMLTIDRPALMGLLRQFVLRRKKDDSLS